MAKGINFNLDTTKSEFQNPMVELRQGDGNYQSLHVTVTSNGEPLDLTGWTITFMGTTNGLHKIVDSSSVVENAVQGTFNYTPTKAWGQDMGEYKKAYFKFTNGGQSASSANFRVTVFEAVDLTEEEAGDYISVVDQLIEQVKSDMDSKLASTQKTLSDTQSQANTVQNNVNDLNTNVNDLKTQNLNIKTTDNNWAGSNTFNKQIIAPAGVQGNADTAAELQTSRKINGTNFDGTADINVNAANDSNLVHITGTETVAGDKTFTGSVRFSGDVNIVSATAREQILDGYDINGYTDTYKYVINGANNLVNYPSSASTWATLDVEKINPNTSTQTLTDTNNKVFIRHVGGNPPTWSAWTEIANDNKVVHNTGTETAAGDKTFTGVTDIQNQKQYKASFSISSNTINLTRMGSIVYVNTRITNQINAGSPVSTIPSGFVPISSSVISFIRGANQGTCLFQSQTKDVFFPVNVPVDANMSGSYITSDPLPSQ